MKANPYQKYLEHEVLTAEPIRLVQLLYQGVIEAVASARRMLARGDIKGRSAAVTKAVEILTELSAALDHNQGGELSSALAALYDYAQRRLLEGNHEQKDQPLAEAERILRTLGEAWLKIEVPAGVKAVHPAVGPLSATEFAADAAGHEYQFLAG